MQQKDEVGSIQTSTDAVPSIAVNVADAGAITFEADPTPTLMDTVMRFRVAVIATLIVVGLVSALPLRQIFTTPDTFAPVMSVLDEKKNNVTAMVAAATAASVTITAAGPDDAGTPLADKLMDLSSNLMLVLGVLYLEKYLLTVFGFVTFGILVPVAMAMLVIATLLYYRSTASGAIARLSVKLIVLGAVLFATVPAGVAVTKMIDNTYNVSYAVDAETEDTTQEESEDGGGTPLDFILSIPETVATAATDVIEGLLGQVNHLIEGVAIMIVTSCVIPILVLLFFLWMANLLLGINVSAPTRALAARAQRMKVSRSDITATKQALKKARDAKRD